MGLSIYDERYPIVAAAYLEPADTTNPKAIVPAVVAACRIDELAAISLCTAAHVVFVVMVSGATQINLGSISIPSTAGVAGSPLLNLMTTLAPPAQGAWILPVGFALSVKVSTAIPAGEAIGFTALGGYV